jgi:hypothetical protein
MAEPAKAESVVAPPAVRGVLTPARCAKFVRKRIAARLPEICEGLVTKAEKGDLAALKALLQMAALDSSSGKGAGDSKHLGTAEQLTKHLAFVRKTLTEFRQDRSG